jgi:anti-anti-sigma factor
VRLRIAISSPGTDTIVVIPSGEADTSTVAGLRQALMDVVATGPARLVVDLDRLSFMDASALGVLVQARAGTTAAGGRFEVVVHHAWGRRLLEVTGLAHLLRT